MEELDSVFIYQEREHELRQKLIDTTLELETMKSIKTELFNLLKTAYQERDEARNQLQNLMNKLIPTSPIHLQDMLVQQESPLMFHSSKPNPSLTESSSLSHGSPPVDSFFETVSSPEFSNSNMCHLKYHQNRQNLVQVQDFNYLMVPTEKPVYVDRGTLVIDSMAKERVLPQKGKLLQAVVEAGPLLQNILLAGPLPTWRNPPPLKDIKLPSLNIKEYNNSTNNAAARIIEPVSFPKVSSVLQSSNATSSCSTSSMLHFTGNHILGSWNGSRKFINSDSSSSSSLMIQAGSRKRQRYP
ncbi:uncharacterized protein LOC123918505 [Trifolium pratense]|uniref:uncharacterized protein LOC123918505 n=1 Tax=Trifolium pratense TaxID=57577 RepID=UPI001E694421|nr:uncharacterized protein LOC123918505 [Trifolium pratense]